MNGRAIASTTGTPAPIGDMNATKSLEKTCHHMTSMLKLSLQITNMADTQRALVESAVIPLLKIEHHSFNIITLRIGQAIASATGTPALTKAMKAKQTE